MTSGERAKRAEARVTALLKENESLRDALTQAREALSLAHDLLTRPKNPTAHRENAVAVLAAALAPKPENTPEPRYTLGEVEAAFVCLRKQQDMSDHAWEEFRAALKKARTP